MKYKALYSPKQFFTVKGSTYKAQDGIFITEDKDVITFLDGHFAWKPLSKTPAEPKAPKAPKAGK